MVKSILLVLICLFCILSFAQKNDTASSGKSSQAQVAQPKGSDQYLDIYRCLSGRRLDPKPEIGQLKTNNANMKTEFSTVRIMTEKAGFFKGEAGKKDSFKPIANSEEKRLSLEAARQVVLDLRPTDTTRDILFYLEEKEANASNAPGSLYLSHEELQRLAKGLCSCEKINGINLESLSSTKRALSRNQKIQVKENVNAEPRVLSYSELGCK